MRYEKELPKQCLGYKEKKSRKMSEEVSLDDSKLFFHLQHAPPPQKGTKPDTSSNERIDPAANYSWYRRFDHYSRSEASWRQEQELCLIVWILKASNKSYRSLPDVLLTNFINQTD